jgi:hypothetical protein
MSTSKHLSATQMRGLARVGDIVIPGDDVLPPFTRSGSLDHVDRMLDHMSDFDRDGVKLLLTIFRFLPGFVIVAILKLVQHDKRLPGFLGAACRMVNIGIKGVVMSLYYSDLGPRPLILPAIGYDAKIVVHDRDGGTAA